MAFTPNKKTANDFNGGIEYKNGDGVQAETINNLVEGVLYAQENVGNNVENGEGTGSIQQTGYTLDGVHEDFRHYASAYMVATSQGDTSVEAIEQIMSNYTYEQLLSMIAPMFGGDTNTAQAYLYQTIDQVLHDNGLEFIDNQANSSATTVLGVGNISYSPTAFVNGYKNIVGRKGNALEAINSITTGSEVENHGANSIVGGEGNKVYETCSLAIGRNNTIQDTSAKTGTFSPFAGCSIAAGSNNKISTPNSIVAGDGNTVIRKPHDNEGKGNIVGGINNYIGGKATIVGGMFIGSEESPFVAEGAILSGYRHTLSGQGSFTIVGGSSNDIAGYYQIVGGRGNTAYAQSGLTVGDYNTNKSPSGIVCGDYNDAKHAFSLVAGYGNKTTAHNCIVAGQYNAVNDKENILFALGIGTSDTDRKNGLEVYKDGTVKVYDAATDSMVKVATESQIGDIRNVLDSIMAMQNSLIGGNS